ncbi:MAG: site-2 protease family protein [Halothece sp.]
MQVNQTFYPKNADNWLCPNLADEWELNPVRKHQPVILKFKQEDIQHEFTHLEGYALRHFTGRYTVAQIQRFCQDFCSVILNENLPSDLVINLVEKLFALGILENADDELINSATKDSGENTAPELKLKSCVHWISHSSNYWILRNTEDITYLQVDQCDYEIISQFDKKPLAQIVNESGISIEELQEILKLLAATGMLEGTEPAKPNNKKFNLLQLLSFKLPLWNPDVWLSKNLNQVQFLFTRSFAFFILQYLTLFIIVAFQDIPTVVVTGHELWASYGAILLFPFALFMTVVVFLHELAHAFTLKHYGGIVPEIGLLFILFIPGAYTNTTDAYCLVKRRQRTLVVAAGVLCQMTLGAIAWTVWKFIPPDYYFLKVTAYLFMISAFFTITLNLNPLNKFDGYYLTVALTGINNLRERSLKFFMAMLQKKPTPEKPSDQLVMIFYAPLSLLYTGWVLSKLLLWIWGVAIANTLITTLVILTLIVWAIYFYVPISGSQSQGENHPSKVQTQDKRA